jgi:rhamnosyltransferase
MSWHARWRRQSHAEAVPAAIVLFEPDAAVLDAQLSALDRGGRRLIFFANGRLSAAVEIRLAKLANAVVLRSPTNIGLGEGLNAVASQAVGEGFTHLLLLDQDSEPHPDLPESLRAHFVGEDYRVERVAAVGPRLVPPEGGRYLRVRYQWRNAERDEALFLPTSGSLLSLSAYQEIGPFRSDYFVAGIDVEWGLRAYNSGYRLMLARDLPMVHRWGFPLCKGGRALPQILRNTPLRNYYYIRNAVDCLRQPHSPLTWRLRYGTNLAGQIARLLMAQGHDPMARRAVRSAVRDGLARRLGVAPDHFLAER